MNGYSIKAGGGFDEWTESGLYAFRRAPDDAAIVITVERGPCQLRASTGGIMCGYEGTRDDTGARVRVSDMAINLPRTYRTEFPDFDPATLPPIPAGWVDSSWHNDTCPSFEIGETNGLHVFVDYADPALRECADAGEGERFSVLATDERGCLTSGPALLHSDNWGEVLAFAGAYEKGFRLETVGGGGSVLSLYSADCGIWVSCFEGGGLPTLNDWQVCLYVDANPDAAMLDFSSAMDGASVDIFAAINKCVDTASAQFLVSVSSRTMGPILTREPSLARVLARFFGPDAEPYFLDDGGEEEAKAEDIARRLSGFDPVQIYDDDREPILIQRDAGKA